MNALARMLPRMDVPGSKDARPGNPLLMLNRAEPPDPAAPLAEAEERGRLAGLAAARAEMERTRAEDAAAAEKRLAEERQRWAAEQGEVLANALATGLKDIERSLIECVEPVLAPFIHDSLRRRALEELRELIAGLIEGGKHPLIRISGPEDLLKPLRERFGGEGAVEFSAGQDPDVRVVAGQTIARTQIAAWREKIAAAAD